MRSLFRLIPATILAMLASEIVLISTVYIVAAVMLSTVDPLVWLLHVDGLARVGLMVLGVMLGLYFQDLYSDLRVKSPFLLFQQVCLVIGIAFLFQALLSYLAPNLVLPRWIMMIGSIALLVILPLWRWAFARTIVHAMADERVLFLGANALVREIAQRIAERPELGMSVAGYLEVPERQAGLPADRVLGVIDDVRRVAEQVKPTRIVVGLSERRAKLPVEDLLDLGFGGTRIEDAEKTFEDVFGRVSTEQLRPSQLIFSSELGPRPYTVQLQTIYSTLIALIGLVIAFPVMILVAIAVRLTSPGPVLYRQTRVGLRGHNFTLYKFRSMRADAEKGTGAVWATKADPRITPLGKWLRKLRLDELPQLINVLKGEMALVGPRPERPEFVDQLAAKIPFFRQRHCVKPGITGWAQINHKYGDTLEDTVTKLEYDLYYIKNLSPALDFYVMFHTVKVMLLSRGAQ